MPRMLTAPAKQTCLRHKASMQFTWSQHFDVTIDALHSPDLRYLLDLLCRGLDPWSSHIVSSFHLSAGIRLSRRVEIGGGFQLFGGAFTRFQKVSETSKSAHAAITLIFLDVRAPRQVKNNFSILRSTQRIVHEYYMWLLSLPLSSRDPEFQSRQGV
ncbi:hypothetical protein KC322_g53 [Hortaea werneckii]|nr:hypothetical protein KC322_g53 [Hortaea werneckii]